MDLASVKRRGQLRSACPSSRVAPRHRRAGPSRSSGIASAGPSGPSCTEVRAAARSLSSHRPSVGASLPISPQGARVRAATIKAGKWRLGGFASESYLERNLLGIYSAIVMAN